MRIGVTGSSGIIGSFLCSTLDARHTVLRFDILGTKAPVNICSPEELQVAFHGCESIVHLAAASQLDTPWDVVNESIIRGTRNVLEAAYGAGVKTVVLASSLHVLGGYEGETGDAIYQPCNGTVLRSDTPVRPDTFYAVGKVAAEALGRFYSDYRGLNVICIRIGTINRNDNPYEGNANAAHPELSDDQKRKRYSSKWMSRRDFATLVEAILSRPTRFAIVYGVSDNSNRFCDLEETRARFNFRPLDGAAVS